MLLLRRWRVSAGVLRWVSLIAWCWKSHARLAICRSARSTSVLPNWTERTLFRLAGDTDRFSMSISGDRVRVDETQSGRRLVSASEHRAPAEP